MTISDVDIHAYHLVASSQLGDSSVLLLDGRGCPTGQVDFPSLVHTRLPPGSNIGFNEKGEEHLYALFIRHIIMWRINKE